MQTRKKTINDLRPDQLIPWQWREALLVEARRDRNWMRFGNDGNNLTIDGSVTDYALHAHFEEGEPVVRLAKMTNAYLFSMWMLDGPKVFLPSAEQQEALANVAVNLSIDDYTQPYHTIMIKVDLPPVYAVLMHHTPQAGLVAVIMNENEPGNPTFNAMRVSAGVSNNIETELTEYGVTLNRPWFMPACRVAINACLALSHFGNHKAYLFPREVETDQMLAKESSERGDRAKRRLSIATEVLTFEQHVKLYRERKASARLDGEPTGSEVKSHWRKGHWAMQPCGKASESPDGKTHQFRKRIIRRPILVRADKFVGPLSATSATYKG